MIGFEIEGDVAVITLRRPEARNAIDGAMAEAIEAAIDRLEATASLRVGVLAAEGPAFSAGADLKAIAAGGLATLRTRRGGFAGIVRRERTKPLIAAVDGPALAGGCEIVLACDLLVASTRSSFGCPEVKRSLVAAGGGMFRLAQRLPSIVAMEILLTGDPISAERAFACGMVNLLVEPGQVVPEATALARRIAVNAPLAVQETRAVAAAAGYEDERALWTLSGEALKRISATEDFQEGPRAFVEKRPPVWQGR
jgi:enoyl-CoA hydratase